MKKIMIFIVVLAFSGNTALTDDHALPKKGKISWLTGWQFNMSPCEAQSDE